MLHLYQYLSIKHFCQNKEQSLRSVIIRHNISARKYTVQSHNMSNESLIKNRVKILEDETKFSQMLHLYQFWCSI